MSHRYYLETFGCRVNQADSAGIAADLEARSFVRSRALDAADVVVLNTCTVTHRSDADVRKAVRRVRRENPGAKILVTGCYAQRDPDAVASLGGVAAVVGNAHRASLPILADDLVHDLAHGVACEAPSSARPVVLHTPMDGVDPWDLPPIEPVTAVLDRTRPFVKIQDGCDASCTYCIIPAVRGPARSAPPDEVVRAVETLVERGHVEVVLAGVHLGTYGAAFDSSLIGVVRRILEIAGLVRLRLSCIEPMAFPVELAEIARDDRRLAPHFHLPLQSGSDPILKRMVRPYRAEDYVALLSKIRAAVPEACLGTDVIVGFPGETEEDFERTLETVGRAGLDYLHVFSYSDREGTPSTRLGPKVDPRVIKARATRLIAAGDARWRAFLDRQLGRILDAVTLSRKANHPGFVAALTDNYCPVRFEDDRMEGNEAVRLRITARVGDELFGVRAA